MRRWLSTLVAEEPLLLMQPLTRFGGKLTTRASNESEWKSRGSTTERAK